MANLTEEAASLILKCLADESRIDSYEFCHRVNIDHQVVVGAIKSLVALGDVSKNCYVHVLFQATIRIFPIKKKKRLSTLKGY